MTESKGTPARELTTVECERASGARHPGPRGRARRPAPPGGEGSVPVGEGSALDRFVREPDFAGAVLVARGDRVLLSQGYRPAPPLARSPAFSARGATPSGTGRRGTATSRMMPELGQELHVADGLAKITTRTATASLYYGDAMVASDRHHPGLARVPCAAAALRQVRHDERAQRVSGSGPTAMWRRG
jgi:hypothetical protein